jgi:N6-adenosine-specific RNA methylase IME4
MSVSPDLEIVAMSLFKNTLSDEKQIEVIEKAKELSLTLDKAGLTGRPRAEQESLLFQAHRVLSDAEKAAAAPKNYNGTLGFGGYTSAADSYPTMSVAELLALDVKSLAAADSVLLCWATFPLLPDQLEVVKGWGFKYKTAFVWDKGAGAFGHYHSAEAELLLVCTRGNNMTPEIDKREKQIQHYRKERVHSKKPDEWRRVIDHLWPTGPRICLFRRGALPKPWVVWGNEATLETKSEVTP